MMSGLAGCLLLASTSFAGTAAYSITVLGTANGIGLYPVQAINSAGQVIGGNGMAHAALWTPAQPNGTSGTLVDLQMTAGFPTGSSTSVATALNDQGEVTGSAYTPGSGDDNQMQAWLWKPSGRAHAQSHAIAGKTSILPLVATPGSASSAGNPLGINNQGQIVGRGSNDNVVMWTPNRPNGTVGGWTFDSSVATPPVAINDAGQIAGNTDFSSDHIPYLDSSLPISASDFISSGLWFSAPNQSFAFASGLNQAGHLAISATTPTFESRAFLYADGTVTDISGDQASSAAAINDADDVVGQGSASNAMLFTQGTALDLNVLVPMASMPASWHLDRAVGINDFGQIICSGTYDDGSGAGGQAASFLLTPVSHAD